MIMAVDWNDEGTSLCLIPYLTVAYSLFGPCECVKRKRTLYLEESSATAQVKTPPSVSEPWWYWYRALSNRVSSLMRNMTFGCLMPIIRPHSDRSSEISHPTSSYWASWCILFVLGCTIIRFTWAPFFPPPSRRRAQWEGVNGALLSHMLQVSARIPTTPLPSKVSLPCEWKCNQHN